MKIGGQIHSICLSLVPFIVQNAKAVTFLILHLIRRLVSLARRSRYLSFLQVDLAMLDSELIGAYAEGVLAAK